MQKTLFWSSVDLTGNQTRTIVQPTQSLFWSSVDLTGNQTPPANQRSQRQFWSSVDLTGNQTLHLAIIAVYSFGAVSI